MNLNLEAQTKPEEKIKVYMEANVSDVLAEKINNETTIIKDGKTLVNKKTLAGFMKYATEEARKLISKGASSTCVEDDLVYGWKVYYFEESSIEETLYNEDGTPFKKQLSPALKAPTVKYKPPKPKPKPQMSLFELLEPLQRQEDVSEDEDEEPTGEEICEAAEEIALRANPETGELLSKEKMYEFDGDIEEPDMDEGEIDTFAFDTTALAILDELFGNKLEVR